MKLHNNRGNKSYLPISIDFFLYLLFPFSSVQNRLASQQVNIILKEPFNVNMLRRLQWILRYVIMKHKIHFPVKQQSLLRIAQKQVESYFREGFYLFGRDLISGVDRYVLNDGSQYIPSRSRVGQVRSCVNLPPKMPYIEDRSSRSAS